MDFLDFEECSIYYIEIYQQLCQIILVSSASFQPFFQLFDGKSGKLEETEEINRYFEVSYTSPQEFHSDDKHSFPPYVETVDCCLNPLFISVYGVE